MYVCIKKAICHEKNPNKVQKQPKKLTLNQDGTLCLFKETFYAPTTMGVPLLSLAQGLCHVTNFIGKRDRTICN